MLWTCDFFPLQEPIIPLGKPRNGSKSWTLPTGIHTQRWALWSGIKARTQPSKHSRQLPYPLHHDNPPPCIINVFKQNTDFSLDLNILISTYNGIFTQLSFVCGTFFRFTSSQSDCDFFMFRAIFKFYVNDVVRAIA